MQGVSQPLRLIEDRLISGRGVLRIPETCLRARYWIIYVDVIRKPKNIYANLDWFPTQALFARCTYRRKGYVQSSDTIRYEREERTYINDITGQNLRGIKGAYDGLLRTMVALGSPDQPVNVTVADIKDYQSLALGYDEVIFKCYADTALQVRLYCKDYDENIYDVATADIPEAPPNALPQVPSGEAIGSISAPYENDTITQPYSGDEVEDITDGTENNKKYAIFFRVYADWGSPDGNTPGKGTYIDVGREVWGRIYGLVTNRIGTPYVGIDCHGDAALGYGQRQQIIVFSGVPNSSQYADAEILRIEPR